MAGADRGAADRPTRAPSPATGIGRTPYLQIVEFPSFEAAMSNSGLPETAALAEKLRALCDGPIAFRNLDVLSVEDL